MRHVCRFSDVPFLYNKAKTTMRVLHFEAFQHCIPPFDGI